MQNGQQTSIDTILQEARYCSTHPTGAQCLPTVHTPARQLSQELS